MFGLFGVLLLFLQLLVSEVIDIEACFPYFRMVNLIVMKIVQLSLGARAAAYL